MCETFDQDCTGGVIALPPKNAFYEEKLFVGSVNSVNQGISCHIG